MMEKGVKTLDKFASVEITEKEDGTTEVKVNGFDLSSCLTGVKYSKKAGDIPNVTLDIAANYMKLNTQMASLVLPQEIEQALASNHGG